MDGLKEFLESSTIHGLFYIATNRRVARLLWICVVIAGFTTAGVLICQSFASWEESPVSTTIETRSISDLEFPGVVVCPAKNSFTTLNPDLIRDKNLWDGNTIRRLKKILLEDTSDSNVENKFKEMTSFFEKDKFFNWYKGESALLYPSIGCDFLDRCRKYFAPKTSATSGKFATPYFREPFHEEDFLLVLTFDVTIYVPEEIRKNGSISLVIDIDYDIEGNWFSRLVTRATRGQVYRSRELAHELNDTQKKYKKEFSLQGDDFYRVTYTRDIQKKDYQFWKSKRNTGLSVSWYYKYNVTVQPEQKFLSANQEFITLVNAVHENRTDLREELKRKREEALDDNPRCVSGRLYSGFRGVQLPSLGNVSAEPLYTANITQETLATAGRLYFYFREGFIQISTLTAFKGSTVQKRT